MAARTAAGPVSMAGVAAGVLLSPSVAQAHFRLLYPPQWIQESSTATGDPQKSAPCGTDATTPGTPTHAITSFAPGATVHLHFVETVPHDGWYRISISYKADRSDLTDPSYQTNPPGCLTNGTPGLLCNSVDAGIENPPAPPVLVDGLYKHAGSIQTPKDYTYDLTLPMTTCDKCTLQVEQIMLNHPVNVQDGPFTYHHCADIAIVAGGDGGTVLRALDGGAVAVRPDSGTEPSSSGGTSSGATGSSTGATSGGSGADPDGGGTAGDDGGGSSSGNNGGGSSTSGCAASGRGTTAAAGFGLLVGAVAAGIRRRRRRTAAPARG